MHAMRDDRLFHPLDVRRLRRPATWRVAARLERVRRPRRGRFPARAARPRWLPAWPAEPVWASVLLAWASLLPVLASRTHIGRQVDAKWTPSWTAKTAANANVHLKSAKTAAKSHRTPC